MLIKRPPVEETQLFAVIVCKAGIEMEFLAFAPGGRPAVYFTRAQAAGWLAELLKAKQAVAGRVEKWLIKR
jgi:hypothetical protein